jgi:NDP-sugar pyrophosphorylase family protein
MNLEQLQEEWDVDCQIDDNYLGESAVATPKLHAKYIRFLISVKLKHTKLSSDYNILRKNKFRYYRGELSRDELIDLGWEQWQGVKPLKNEMDEFLAGDSCLMILGDNIFHGAGLGQELQNVLPSTGAHIFTYEVADHTQYGILTTDNSGRPYSIDEKPQHSKSKMAVTGLYYFDESVVSRAKRVEPSVRGELEITSLIESYLVEKTLTYTSLSRGAAWLDTGNPNAMHDAATYIRVIEERTGLKIACLEEVAYRNSWIDAAHLKNGDCCHKAFYFK